MVQIVLIQSNGQNWSQLGQKPVAEVLYELTSIYISYDLCREKGVHMVRPLKRYPGQLYTPIIPLT